MTPGALHRLASTRDFTRRCVRGILLWIGSTGYVASAGQSTITGSVLDQHGNAVKQCLVLMSVHGPEENTIMIKPNSNGDFSHETSVRGLHFLNFVGVGHDQQTIVLYLDEPRQVKLHVVLRREQYLDDLSEAEIRGPDAKSPFNGAPLLRQADDTYIAEFFSKEPVVKYIIIKASRSGAGVPGTNADDYLIEPYGGIFAVTYGLQVAREGKVKIILDPKNTPDEHGAQGPFKSDNSVDTQLTHIYREINNRSVPPDIRDAKLLASQIPQERNSVIRQALWIKYLNTLFPNPEFNVTTPSRFIDAEMIAKALDDLTPASPFWTLRWLFPVSLVQKAVEAGSQPRFSNYIERSIETWPHVMRGWGYSTLISQATERGDIQEADRLYKRLKQMSPGSPAERHETFKRHTRENARIVIGSRVPAFKAHSFEDSTVVYTPDNVHAKFYLIDFWATWCAPCIQKLPLLHEAYEQFHQKGFEIISYSVDANREVVLRFRQEKFAMPWLHSIDPQFSAHESEMVKMFEVHEYPTTFLIDDSGMIVATSEDLKGEKLMTLLKALFEKE